MTKLTVTSGVSSFAGPQVSDQRIVPGCITLIEPGHPLSVNTAPTGGNGLIGSTYSNLAGDLTVSPFILAGPGGTLPAGWVSERSALGGIHHRAPAAAAAGDISLLESGTTDLADHLAGHRSDLVYWSFIITPTQATAQPGTVGISSALNNSGTAGRFQIYVGADNLIKFYSTAGATVGGPYPGQVPATIGTPRLLAFAATDPTTQTLAPRLARWVSTAGGKAALGYVFYAQRTENLAVSGRTFTDALRADQSYFAREFAAGGRYHNDTTH